MKIAVYDTVEVVDRKGKPDTLRVAAGVHRCDCCATIEEWFDTHAAVIHD